ncbi:hypothetical protein JCM10212_004440 [Sporobolomyces blumeae]
MRYSILHRRHRSDVGVQPDTLHPFAPTREVPSTLHSPNPPGTRYSDDESRQSLERRKSRHRSSRYQTRSPSRSSSSFSQDSFEPEELDDERRDPPEPARRDDGSVEPFAGRFSRIRRSESRSGRSTPLLFPDRGSDEASPLVRAPSVLSVDHEPVVIRPYSSLSHRGDPGDLFEPRPSSSLSSRPVEPGRDASRATIARPPSTAVADSDSDVDSLDDPLFRPVASLSARKAHKLELAAHRDERRTGRRKLKEVEAGLQVFVGMEKIMKEEKKGERDKRKSGGPRVGLRGETGDTRRDIVDAVTKLRIGFEERIEGIEHRQGSRPSSSASAGSAQQNGLAGPTPPTRGRGGLGLAEGAAGLAGLVGLAGAGVAWYEEHKENERHNHATQPRQAVQSRRESSLVRDVGPVRTFARLTSSIACDTAASAPPASPASDPLSFGPSRPGFDPRVDSWRNFPLSPTHSARDERQRPSFPPSGQPTSAQPIYISHLTVSQHKTLQHAAAALLLKHQGRRSPSQATTSKSTARRRSSSSASRPTSSVIESEPQGTAPAHHATDEIGVIVESVVGGWKGLVEVVKDGVERVEDCSKHHRNKPQRLFGTSLHELTRHEGTDSHHGMDRSTTLRIPEFVDHCITALKQTDWSVPGILRKSGNARHIMEIIKVLDHEPGTPDTVIDLASIDPVTLADLFKRFLKALPDPVLTGHLFGLFVATSHIKHPGLRRRAMHLVICLMPKTNRDVMECVFLFLDWVSKKLQVDLRVGDRMDLTSIAKIMAPTLLKPSHRDPHPTELNSMIAAVLNLLEDQHILHEIPYELAHLLHLEPPPEPHHAESFIHHLFGIL